ncbi:hypothetical protein RCDORA_99 [Rhodobacter phage RcDora]|nr:hypothetical protein RCAQUAPHINA_102 [Rhodobacter phage RcAquaphina]UUV43368.1 hypothetical protein RCDORA_99 [Rhodobacter phage RcDora]
MARNMTERLLAELNAARGLKYPDIGYCYFADVKGDGTYNPRVYTIVNPQGGVTLSYLNAPSPRERCQKIRAAILEKVQPFQA